MAHYLHGKIPALRISDVADSLLELLPEASFVAVRSIDSTVALQSLQEILNRHHIGFHKSNGNILLSRASFLDAIGKHTFTGFDELWFFERIEPEKNLNGLPRATSDSQDFSISVPPEIIGSARETGCVFLAGDGDGLNYLTSNSALVDALVK